MAEEKEKREREKEEKAEKVEAAGGREHDCTPCIPTAFVSCEVRREGVLNCVGRCLLFYCCLA